MNKKHLTLGLLLALFALPALAQSNNDFGINSEINIEKRLNNRLTSINLGGELRTQNNSKDVERGAVSIGFDHKILNTKRFDIKFGLDYNYIWSQTLGGREATYKEIYEVKPRTVVYEDYPDINGEFAPKGINSGYNTGYNKGYNITPTYWRQRSRVNLSFAFSWKPNKRFSLSLKETLQYTHYRTVSYDRTEYRDKYREKFRIKERIGDHDFTNKELEDYLNSCIAKGYDPVNIDEDVDILYYKDENSPETYKDNPEYENWEETSVERKVKYCKDRFMLRNKLSAQYDIRHTPLAPFASVDFGVGLGYDAIKWKFTAGTDININKHNSFEIYYRYQTENDDDEPNGHLLGLGYKLKF